MCTTQWSQDALFSAHNHNLRMSWTVSLCTFSDRSDEDTYTMTYIATHSCLFSSCGHSPLLHRISHILDVSDSKIFCSDCSYSRNLSYRMNLLLQIYPYHRLRRCCVLSPPGQKDGKLQMTPSKGNLKSRALCFPLHPMILRDKNEQTAIDTFVIAYHIGEKGATSFWISRKRH